MKKIVLFNFTFFIWIDLFGQIYNTVQKVVPILTAQNFYLNGRSNATFKGGKSRSTLLITLPKNTIQWYYVFSTTPNQDDGAQTINLFAQLTKLVDPTGVSAVVASAILAPTGNGGACDIYLLDPLNRYPFMNKEDAKLFGDGFSYLPQGTRLNFTHGVVPIDVIQPLFISTTQDFYLGFKNPSTSTGINVTVEVVAIVKEKILDNTVWSEKSKKNFYNSNYKSCKREDISETISKEIAGCMTEKIMLEKTPEEYDKMNEGSRIDWIKAFKQSCMEKYKPVKSEEQQKGTSLGELGWSVFENGDLDKAIEHCKKALVIDNTLGVVKTHLGLFYLIKDDANVATEYYLDAITDLNRDKISVKENLKNSLNNLKKAGKKYDILKDGKTSKSIKGLLETELKKHK